MTSDAAMETLLARADPFWNEDASPIYTEADLQAIKSANDARRRLVKILLDPVASLRHRFAAVEALDQAGWRDELREHADVAATVMAQAIAQDGIHNRWGLPGHMVGRSGKLLISLGPHATTALLPLLQNRKELNIIGSQASTMHLRHHYRVRDLAAFLLAEPRRLPWNDAPDPTARDTSIDAIRDAVMSGGAH